MLPVERGYCRYESLIDGTLSLVDLAEMHEAIAVADENLARARQAASAADR